MIARSWPLSWTAFGFRVRVGAGVPAPVPVAPDRRQRLQLSALPAIAAPAAAFRTPSHSAAINARNAPPNPDARWLSTRWSMPDATSWNACNNRLKQWRGLATRYEKRAVNYRAMLVLASIVLWFEP